MENKACSSGSTPQVGKSFCLGDVFETHMENFYKQTYQQEKMKKLTESLMMKLASSVPSGLLNRDIKIRVEESLQRLAPLFHTPTHPDYASMIYTAIDELEAKRGSTSEEAISEFIKERFEDLPLAHDLMLRHYLKKLCGNKEVFRGFGGFYTLAVETRQKWKRRRALWKGRSRGQENVTEDQRLRVCEQAQQCEVTKDDDERQDQISFDDDLVRPPGF